MKVGRLGYRLVNSEDATVRVGAPVETLRLSGPPSRLAGSLQLRNDGAERALFREVTSLEKVPGLSGSAQLSLSGRLEAGETRACGVRASVADTTPPGCYTVPAKVGGQDVVVELAVEGKRSVQIAPKRLQFFGLAPGRVHDVTLTLINTGNVPVTVPEVHHSTMLDADTFCRAMSLALRKHGAEGAQPTLDGIARSLRKDLADWVDIRLVEAGKVVQPGMDLTLHLKLTQPKDVKGQYEYRGAFRLFDRLVRYAILPDACAADEPQPSVA